MARAVLLLAAVGVTIYAAVDCLRSPAGEVRALPKPLWLLVIVAIPLAGGLAWIAVGRPIDGGLRATGRRLTAPDDDPDFLRSLRRRPEDDL